MRVLLIEDYKPLRDSIAKGLMVSGYAVDAVANGTDGLMMALRDAYDVILLDIMLPGKDGLSILQTLRAKDQSACILMITAKDTLTDKIHGLELGADDYLVKPFAFQELQARVKALVRRRYGAPSPKIVVGDLEVDTWSKTAKRNGDALALTAKEYAILEVLAFRRGKVVSREQLLDRLYDMNAEASSNVIEVYMRRLRKKMENGGRDRLIHTRRGQGYILYEGDA